MILRKPVYFDSFHCIGSACKDTCCAGWEVEIDEESAAGYHDIDGEIGERLKANITETEEEIYFNLREDKRCPFLNEDNLCDLILHLGEDSLCDICREHPRHYEWFGRYTEVGLGLCCEEAGRLIFSSPEKITYIEMSDDGSRISDDGLQARTEMQAGDEMQARTEMKAEADMGNRICRAQMRRCRSLRMVSILSLCLRHAGLPFPLYRIVTYLCRND